MSLSFSLDSGSSHDRYRSHLGDYAEQLGRIADRHAAEAALKLGKEQAERAAAAAIQALEKSQAAERTKSEFLANMSHELKTPLNSILGFSELLMSPAPSNIDPAKSSEYASHINGAARQLLTLIDDLIDLSQVEFGRVDLDERDVDLLDAVEFCLNLAGDHARRGGLALHGDLPGRLPTLWADERRLKQILGNLLSNAVKFTPPGGVVLLKVVAEPESDLVIKITDTGIGIRPEHLDRVTVPFSHLASDSRRRFDGAGLGLALCESYVQLHGGQLTIESNVSFGTTVTVSFPAHRVRWSTIR
jgi:signal transduction histidine kinase